MTHDRLVELLELTCGGLLDPVDCGVDSAEWAAAQPLVEQDPLLRALRDELRDADATARRAVRRMARGDDDALVAGVLSGLVERDEDVTPVPAGRVLRLPLRTVAAAALLLAVPVVAWKSVERTVGPSAGFVDVARAAGVDRVGHAGSMENKQWMVEVVGHGAAALDYDGDGDLDLFVPDGHELEPDPARGSTWRMFRNEGDFRFTDVTAESGLDRTEWGCGAVAGDLDGDGHTDLFVPCWGANRLFRNRGDGTFEDVTERAGVAGLDEEWSTAAALGDIDGDGDLDLYVANYADIWNHMRETGGSGRACKWKDLEVPCGPAPLIPQHDRLYVNRGDGTFEDVTEERLPTARRYSFQPLLADLTDDGHLDLFVAADDHPNLLLVNDGTGHFVERAEAAGVAYDRQGQSQACMGVAYGDTDGDGRGDLFVTNFSHEPNALYRAHATGFSEVTSAARLAAGSEFTLGWGATFFDFDLDGALDLAVANGHLYPDVAQAAPETSYEQPLSILRNAHDGTFDDVSHALGSDVLHPRVHGGLVVADFDDDGRSDVFVTVLGERAVMLRNQVPAAGNSVRLSLLRADGRTEAAGAKVRLTVQGAQGPRVIVRDLLLGSSFASSEDPRLLVGIGDAERVERVEVTWPGGKRQRFGSLAAGGWFRLVEGTDAPERLR